MTNNEIFIVSYNKLENILHKLPNAPIDANMKWYEDSLEDAKIKNKLYLCRILRNYIQHNEDASNFVEITNEMCSFIQDEYINMCSKMVSAETIMTPIKKMQVVEQKDLVLNAIDLMINKSLSNLSIIDDGKLLGVLSLLNALKIQKDATKKTTIKSCIEDKKITIPKDSIKFVSKTTLASEVVEIFESSRNSKKQVELIYVTDTGNSKGNILGVIFRENILNIQKISL